MTKTKGIYIIGKVCETHALDLYEVFKKNGIEKTFGHHISFNEIMIDGFDCEISENLDPELRFTPVKEKEIRFRGKFDFSLKCPCSRCLKEVCVPVSFEADEILKSNADENEDEDEGILFIEGTEFDVDEFLKQSIVINVPSKVLCRDDCKGLCPVCGCDLNETTCNCDTFVPDPRLAGIMDIFKGNKEV